MSKTKAIEKITLEKLVKITERGFNGLGKEMAEGFAHAEKRTDDKMEKLAVIIQKGFEETATKAETATKTDLEVVKTDLTSLKNNTNYRFDKVDERLDKIERKLDNVVYQEGCQGGLASHR